MQGRAKELEIAHKDGDQRRGRFPGGSVGKQNHSPGPLAGTVCLCCIQMVTMFHQ